VGNYSHQLKYLFLFWSVEIKVLDFLWICAFFLRSLMWNGFQKVNGTRRIWQNCVSWKKLI